MTFPCPNCGIPAIEHGIYCQACYRLVDMDELTEIMPCLFLGGEASVFNFAGDKLDVRPWVLFPEYSKDRTSLLTMLSLCQLIHARVQIKKSIAVYCAAGAERSPLVIACYLVLTGKYPTFYKAYKFLQSIRPIVLDHSDLLHPDMISVIERRKACGSQVCFWTLEDFVKEV